MCNTPLRFNLPQPGVSIIRAAPQQQCSFRLVPPNATGSTVKPLESGSIAQYDAARAGLRDRGGVLQLGHGTADGFLTGGPFPGLSEIAALRVVVLAEDLVIRLRSRIARSFKRMSVGSGGMSVSELAMFVSRSCVLLGFFVFAQRVVMLGLMVMMRSRVVVGGRLMMMLARRVLR
jgi:hypothetical protein